MCTWNSKFKGCCDVTFRFLRLICMKFGVKCKTLNLTLEFWVFSEKVRFKFNRLTWFGRNIVAIYTTSNLVNKCCFAQVKIIFQHKTRAPSVSCNISIKHTTDSATRNKYPLPIKRNRSVRFLPINLRGCSSSDSSETSR